MIRLICMTGFLALAACGGGRSAVPVAATGDVTVMSANFTDSDPTDPAASSRF